MGFLFIFDFMKSLTIEKIIGALLTIVGVVMFFLTDPEYPTEKWALFITGLMFLSGMGKQAISYLTGIKRGNQRNTSNNSNMSITYLETGRTTTALSDGTSAEVVTYDVLDNGIPIAFNQKESQVEDTRTASPTFGDLLCWHNKQAQSVLEATTFTEYVQDNAAGDSYLPKPKGSKNPGGSPVKY